MVAKVTTVKRYATLVESHLLHARLLGPQQGEERVRELNNLQERKLFHEVRNIIELQTFWKVSMLTS